MESEDIARAKGALEEGQFRVVVFEADGRTTVRDFASCKLATQYADDVASEGEPASATVFDAHFRCVRGGRHFGASK